MKNILIFILLIFCLRGYSQFIYNSGATKARVDTVESRHTDIHMNDSVIFHAGTNFEDYKKSAGFGLHIDDNDSLSLGDVKDGDSWKIYLGDSTFNFYQNVDGDGISLEIGEYEYNVGVNNGQGSNICYTINIDTNRYQLDMSGGGDESLTNDADSDGMYWFYSADTVLKVTQEGIETENLIVNGEIEDHVIKSFTVDCSWDSVVGQWYHPIVYSPSRDLVILRIIFQEVVALASTSGTTTLYFMDEGSSSVYLGSIVADGSGPLELTFETLRTYPYRVNGGDGTGGFSFFTDVQDLTAGLLRVTIEYIDY